MFEVNLLNLLSSLVGGRIYWDTTPDGYVIAPGNAFIILQRIGGKANWYFNNSPMPSHSHARVMVTVQAQDSATESGRLIVSPLARLAEVALAQCIEHATPAYRFVVQAYSAPMADFDEFLKLAISQQQFGIWFPE